ncbi:MAG: hypothetical protein RTU92_07490 [Candidatus Thorarchaeota archaeon]
MPAETSDIGALEKKVDQLAEALAAIQQELKDVRKEVTPVSKLDDIMGFLKEIGTGVKASAETKDLDALGKRVDGLIGELKKSKDSENLIKKIDDVLGTVQGLGTTLDKVKENSEASGIEKKLDDILGSIVGVGNSINEIKDSSDSEIISKKIDDLQQYVAGLSTLEETVQELSDSFIETKEIVGIIVRQLDDIERKYNKSKDEITEAVALMSKMMESVKSAPPEATTARKPPTDKKPTDKTKPSPDAALPNTISGLMDYLLELVTPQTEAVDMASALERVRDQITTLISGHTPVLFQFGKRARELKSYPPTATLNENDIARLSKEIRTWASKLEEMANED